jgi:hypothetical protein
MSRLYGVFYGLNMHTHPNEQQINRKSYAHQILPQPIENKFDPRPQETRHVKFPALVNKSEFNMVNPNTQLAYVPNAQQGTFVGFSSHIDDETILRNQTFALQKSDKAAYIPDSNSDLYVESVQNRNGNPGNHKLLWDNYAPLPSMRNVPSQIGADTFNNHTRVQRNNN